jgi:hypothetical protein
MEKPSPKRIFLEDLARKLDFFWMMQPFAKAISWIGHTLINTFALGNCVIIFLTVFRFMLYVVPSLHDVEVIFVAFLVGMFVSGLVTVFVFLAMKDCLYKSYTDIGSPFDIDRKEVTLSYIYDNTARAILILSQKSNEHSDSHRRSRKAWEAYTLKHTPTSLFIRVNIDKLEAILPEGGSVDDFCNCVENWWCQQSSQDTKKQERKPPFASALDSIVLKRTAD